MTEVEVMRLVRFGVETLNMYQEGELSDAELEARWEDMKAAIDDANDLWERAGERGSN